MNTPQSENNKPVETAPESKPQTQNGWETQERVSPKSPTERMAAEEAPKRPEGKKKKRRDNPFVVFLNGMLTLLLMFVVVLLGAIYYVNSEFNAPNQLTENQVILINSGTSLAEISSRLEELGAVSNEWIFNFGVRLNRKAGQVKAGEYEIVAGSSMRDVMDKLVAGRSIVHRVTLPEGLTSLQIVERLRQNEVLVGEIIEVPEEGALMPETYTFTRGETRASVIARMRRAQEEALQRIWESRNPDLPLESPEELVILASIVEKETGVSDERAKVAGVFVNRLNRGMRLQSDPTIIYGLVGGVGTLGRGILRSEIQSDTPYNTYVIDGLPVGPIANPGLAALMATANPEEHDYYYFVADGTGGHAFGRTLEEHNSNVARWRQIEAQRRAGGSSPSQ